MSKTHRSYNEEYYNDDEEYFTNSTDYRQHWKEKRLSRALKTKDLDDLLNLEDEEF